MDYKQPIAADDGKQDRPDDNCNTDGAYKFHWQFILVLTERPGTGVFSDLSAKLWFVGCADAIMHVLRERQKLAKDVYQGASITNNVVRMFRIVA